jgi:hypothetical protein
MTSFLRAVGILGYSFKVTGTKAYLANTEQSKTMVTELLGIAKYKEYVYQL